MIHDCVILPGLGGFIANYRPAEINPAGNSINPPSKQILFNRNLEHNDGLLYAHVSRRTGYGYKDVQSLAESFFGRVKKDISGGRKFSLEDIGYFYQDNELQVQFSPEPGSNFLVESFGLPFVQFREFETRISKPVETYRAIEAETDPLARQRRVRRIVISAAAACLAAVLIMVPIRTGIFSEARLDVAGKDALKTIEIPVEPITVKQEPVTATFQLPQPETSFDIIVGSFKDFGNARQLRTQLVEKGYNARILSGESDFYRVSVDQYSNPDEARQALSAVRSQGYESAWLLNN